jgi:hypothetical protein
MRKPATAAASILGALLLAVTTMATAHASPVSDDGTDHVRSADSRLTSVPKGATKDCVDTAHRRDLRAWACVGSDLYANGKVEHLAKDNKPQKPTLTAAPNADDDSWCEPTGLCSRLVNDYIRETKANIWYGYGSENVGTFDAVLRNNLNGRQPRLTTTLIHDEGPALYFPDTRTICWEEESLWPDNECGTDVMGGAFLSTPGARWSSGEKRGAWLENSNEYYHELAASWVPTGRPPLSGTLFETPYFNCYGTSDDNCYFPDE